MQKTFEMHASLPTPVSSQDLPSDYIPTMLQPTDEQPRPEEQDPIQEEMPLLSVLNVVVDHMMVPPTPLEPEEFRHQACRVPVLRVFGPVLRRDSGICVEPNQSACLYIHGAFPYLLARPIAAGPDGSLHHASHLDGRFNLSGHVDWDSVESVQRILPDIQANLEAAIQSSMQVKTQRDDTNTVQQITRVIRRVTVVTGRGFYTYCPGPPAPFLRVEYYDPKLRWKVKLMLERGLDVPRSFQPHPQQYQSAQPQETDDAGSLPFHCYEAHIPYTMQFFKDWNLAGMQYIHLSGARFRHPMPKCARRRFEQQDVPQESLFLESNTPTWNLWNVQDSSSADIPQSMDSQFISFFLQQSSVGEIMGSSQEGNQETSLSVPLQVDANVDPFWSRKETSCDIEMDISVRQILNIKSVMKRLPEDTEERQKIHWRAVPSLREIWRKERQRMTKLLKPKYDFLSHPNGNEQENKQTPPFTLNAKNASVPGARLATEGMSRLFRPSHGLENQFRRAMKQIIQRHSSSVTRVDNVLRGRLSLEHELTVHSSLFPNEESSQLSHNSPPLDVAVEALGALASQFGNGESFEASRANASDQCCNEEGILTPSSHQCDFCSQLSQASSHVSESNNLSQRCTQDPFEFSQRVERGDSTNDDPFGRVEELINPTTLTPYDDPEDADDDGFIEEEEAMSERELENTLSMLATQTFMRDKDSHETDYSQDYEVDNTIALRNAEQPGGGHMLDSRWRESSEDLDEHSDTSLHEDSGLVWNEELRAHHQTNIDDSSSLQSSTSQLTSLATPMIQSEHKPVIAATRIERKESAPTRSDVVGRCDLNNTPSPGLYMLQRARGIPSWLTHSTRYCNIRRALVSQGNLVQEWAAPSAIRDADIEPVIKAPSRRKVKSWSRMKWKLATQESSRPAKKRKTKVGGDTGLPAKSSAFASEALQNDYNSWKLTAVHEPSRKKEDEKLPTNPNASAAAGQEIEEVKWETSQRFMLPMSQSQPESIHEESNQRRAPESSSDQFTPDPFERLPASESGQLLSDSTPQSGSQSISNPLDGIGQQGGRIYVEGGGGLKAKSRSTHHALPVIAAHRQNETSSLHGSDLPAPLSIMSIEVHVQCRRGRAGINDSKEIAMRPNSEKDRIFAVVYVYARDPGGGEALEFLERGCLFVPNEGDQGRTNAQTSSDGPVISRTGHNLNEKMNSSIPHKTMGVSSTLTVEVVRDEKQLLLRLASLVHWKDPDMLLSWDTQGAGLGYIIERGAAIEQSPSDRVSDSSPTNFIDMARLLSRTPRAKKFDDGGQNESASRKVNQLDPALPSNGVVDKSVEESSAEMRWKGSGLGTEWDDRVGAGHAAASINGRLVFSGWKIVAEEVKHPNASYLPAIVSTVLNKRIPFHDDIQLTRWYGCDAGRERWRVLHYRLTQAMACLLLFDALDIAGRAAEAASLSGVEFSQSFPGIRGSQYKVEGVLLRALQSINSCERGAKRGHQKTTLSVDSKKLGIDHESSLSSESKSQTQSPWKVRRRSMEGHEDDATDCILGGNYFFFSPSIQDCSRQEALECQALTLEPQSGCHDDPVVVCDFTALYPSLMIAYNICYSTCAGKLDYHSTRSEMCQEGRTTGRIGPMIYPEARTATVLKDHMKSLDDRDKRDENSDITRRRDRAYAAPSGTIFVSENVLHGVLPQVLDEMLKTRAMLKDASKQYKKLLPNVAPSILRQLEARQLAIKMISNVMYGYTSATFSGRSAMPLVADSIVECGRRTLSNAIDLANTWGRDEKGRWFGAEVIYGDTDSLFIRLRGRSVPEAFEFGELFCKTVTASNPPPVHLKLEKVYKGSIMQTKKKYCGMKYESAEQKKPTFEAKGIETIRRDQCALTQKVLRNALITLFCSGIDAVRTYLYRQWCLILSGRLPVSDFILTGRVRSRYRGGRVGPVQAVLARRLAEADPGRVVRHKERLAYVIVATPGRTFRLRDCVLTPTELLEQWDAHTLHCEYYITKHVNAALQRCLGLSPYKIDVASWYESCPKPRRRVHFWPVTRSGSNIMISSYFGSDTCSLCGKKCQAQGRSRAVVCSVCQKDRVEAAQVALNHLNKTQKEAQKVAKVCSNCNLCFEDSTTFAALKSGKAGSLSGALSAAAKKNPGIVTPIANCTCIDCPNTFERHRLREAELEALAVCQYLDLL